MKRHQLMHNRVWSNFVCGHSEIVSLAWELLEFYARNSLMLTSLAFYWKRTTASLHGRLFATESGKIVIINMVWVLLSFLQSNQQIQLFHHKPAAVFNVLVVGFNVCLEQVQRRLSFMILWIVSVSTSNRMGLMEQGIVVCSFGITCLHIIDIGCIMQWLLYPDLDNSQLFLDHHIIPSFLLSTKCVTCVNKCKCKSGAIGQIKYFSRSSPNCWIWCYI